MIIVNSVKQTANLAERVAKFVLQDFNSTNLSTIILLNGDLGAGKTCFSNFFVNYYLYNKKNAILVNSPTYTIANYYVNNNLSLYHLDLYRLNSVEELIEIGFSEIIKNICIIEWANKIAYNYNKVKTISINIVAQKNIREFTITSNINNFNISN